MIEEFGVLFFLFIQIISFIFICSIRKQLRRHTTQVSNKNIIIIKRVNFVSSLTILLYFFLNFSFDISIAGFYTDFKIGYFTFLYFDIIYLAVLTEKNSIRKLYLKFRALYTLYNSIRFILFWVIGFITTGEMCITYPPENMWRTKDVPIFNNELYLNYTDYPGYIGTNVWRDSKFKIYHRYCGIFERRLSVPEKIAIQYIGLSSLDTFNYAYDGNKIYIIGDLRIVKANNGHYYYYLDSLCKYPKLDTISINNFIKLK